MYKIVIRLYSEKYSGVSYRYCAKSKGNDSVPQSTSNYHSKALVFAPVSNVKSQYGKHRKVNTDVYIQIYPSAPSHRGIFGFEL